MKKTIVSLSVDMDIIEKLKLIAEEQTEGNLSLLLRNILRNYLKDSPE